MDCVDEAAELFQRHREQLGFVNRAQVQSGDLVTATENGDVVAALLGNHCVRKPQSTIYELAVAKTHRRRGYATELVERFATESSHRKLIAKCPVTLPATDFYESTGWERIRIEDGKRRDLAVYQYPVND